MRAAQIRRCAALAGAALAVGVLVAPPAAQAAAPTAAPSLELPAEGATVGGNPVLQWGSVPGAAKYRVQVAATPAFASFLYNVDTVNLQATPTTDLPLGTLYWRVAGTDGASGVGPFSAGSFVKEFTGAPTLSLPVDEAVLVYPDDVPTFTWAPLPGAAKYRLEIDDAADFIGATAVTTPNTAYTLTTPQTIDQAFYWRVRGESGTASVVSDFSPARSYTISWPQDADPDLLSPAPVASGQALPVVQDVVLRWSAVPGAASYRLEVSGNGDWTNNMTPGFPVTVAGTSYSPATTLPDGPYFWRVRANDTASVANAGPWSDPVGQFVKTWNEPVALTSPADGATVVDPPTLRWNPVQVAGVDLPGTVDNESLSSLASYYRVEVSEDSNFTPSPPATAGNVMTCITHRTEFTPYSTLFPVGYQPTNPPLCDVQIVDGHTYWWRVRAVDMPSGVLGGLSAKRSFTFTKGSLAGVQLLSPAHGATVDNPALSWTPVAGVAKYEVEVSGGGSTKTFTTFSTSLTPTTKLGGTLPQTYTWRVRPIDLAGNKGVAPPARSFTLTPPAAPGATMTLTGPADGAHSARMPQLRWTHVTGATKYRVSYSVGGAEVYFVYSDGAALPYPSFTHTGETLLQAGTYSYVVEALNDANSVLAAAGPRTFVLDQLAGATLVSPATCVTIPCTPLADTPTFTWAPVEHAGFYLLHLATDANFNNVVKTYKTEHTSLTPRESLPDSNAGQSYYWYVQPCKSAQACGPFEPPYSGRFSFEKRSAPIEIISPAHGAVVSGPVTFVWKDFLQINQELDTPVTQEARQYRIQVSRVADFVSLLDEAVVDQTTYTPHLVTRTYPDGPLYWRVQAIDASGNALTWSEAPQGSLTAHHLVTKDQAEVVQHDAVPGSLSLSWDAQPFAAKYDVELYKNGDTAWSPGNLLGTGYSGQTKVAGWTPTKALELGTYAWRVRRVDNPGAPAGGTNTDDWSLGKTFTVGAPSAVLVSPDEGSPEADASVLFDWEPVAGAASYRIELSSMSSFATLLESATTVMTEYANTKAIPTGTVYWRVTPLNADGKALAPSTQRTLRRVVTGDFFPLPPVRVLDTRASAPVPGGTAIDVPMTGVGGVPLDHVTAVVLNVTVTGPTASGFLTVWPTGAVRPNASNLNFVVGQTVPNLVKAGVGTGGKVSFFNAAGSVHVLADVLGYYTDGVPAAGSTFTPLSPARILDTRSTGGPIGGGTSREVAVTGVGGVPATGVGAVVLNVTVTAPTSSGYLTVFPKGTARPTASNLNFTKGLTVANLVVAKVGTGGRVMLFNSTGATHAIVDVAGWYTDGTQGSGTHFTALTPSRILDTRTSTPLSGGTSRSVKVTGVGGVPASGVQAVVLNVTAVAPTSTGYLTVFPGSVRPVASNLNFTAKRNVPNLVVVKVANGAVTVFNSNGSTHVLFDVVGWFG